MSAELSAISPTPQPDAPFLTLTEKAVEKVKYFASRLHRYVGEHLSFLPQ